MRAAIYVRMSQASQVVLPDGSTRRETAGVERQEEDCRELCEANGWEVAEVFNDNNRSAMNPRKPRPEYERLVEMVKANHFDRIVCWHADRLYRQPRELEDLVDVVSDRTPIATVKMGAVDLSTPSGLLVAGLLAQVARYEILHKTDRWNRSYRQAREAGRLPRFGHRMFGWTTDGQLVPEEADIVRGMAYDILHQVSVHDICRRLNDAGVLTTRGNPWQPASVRYLLRNPRLAGHSTIGYWETYHDNGKERRRRKTRIVADGQWDPILDRETWEAVRMLLGARSRPQPGRVSLLSGLIYCGRCGQALVTGSHKNGPRAYRCVKRTGQRGAQRCGGVIGAAEPIERIVESSVQGWLEDPDMRRGIQRLRSAGRGVPAELDALQTRLAEIEGKLSDPGESLEALLAAAQKTRERIAELEHQVAASVTARVPLPKTSTWPTDLGRRRRLIELVVARVWLDPAPVKGGRFCEERVRVDPVEG